MRVIMNKIKFFLIIIFLGFCFTIFSQDDEEDIEYYSSDTSTILKDSTTKENQKESTTDILQLQREIDALKKDVKELKDKTDWFSFIFEGSTKVTYGVSLWAIGGTINSSPRFKQPLPIAHGFDFENNIRFKMDLGKKIVAQSKSPSEDGTEIIIKLKFDSLGLSKFQPQGGWYVVDATDDTGKKTQVFFPRLDTSSNVLFGNFYIVLEEAKVNNLMGTGFFFDYSDVKTVHKYYGVEQMVDVLKLNHTFFNNGYIADTSDDTKYDSLYYSFNPSEYSYLHYDANSYEPYSGVSEAMTLWSNGMLKRDPLNPNVNQRPHGFAFGFDKDITDGFHFFAEGGIASKDAFDPRYLEDSYVDYGFFARFSPKFHSKTFVFDPKISLSYAFQTDATGDMDFGWSTFAAGLSLPFDIKLKTGKNDRLKFELNWNINAKFAIQNVATMISFLAELTLLDEKLYIKFPLIYSYKYGKGGFLRVGNENIKFLDQLYEDYLFNMSLIAGFDSKTFFGDTFQYKVSNTIHFTAIYFEYPAEIYFYEILKNEFILHNLGPEKITFYLDFTFGLARNARLIDSTTEFKYKYDSTLDTWVDVKNGEPMKWKRWPGGNALSFELGVNFDIIKNLAVGISAESPKLLLGVINPIGNQSSFGTFKLWSEIKF